MTEQELRALVRDAIAHHQAAAPGGGAALPHGPASDLVVVRQHSSHGLFAVPSGADADGPCVIEPAVQCNHCGYCKSLGH